MGITFFTYKDARNTPELEKVSHCGICIGDGIGMSAQPHGYDYENLNEIFQDPKRRIFFKEPGKLDMLGDDELIKTCKSYLGTPYNFRLATGFAITNSWMARVFLSNTKRKQWLKSFDEKDHLLCSQAVIMMLCLSKFTTDIDFLVTPFEVLTHPLMKDWKLDVKQE